MSNEQAKHTPGPWLRDRASGYACDVRAASGRMICAVAGMRHMARTEEGRLAQREQHEADACLIAAAPELLEALEALMELERRGRLMPIGREWDAARAAIAKATASPSHQEQKE
jgi:hypothetical protein